MEPIITQDLSHGDMECIIILIPDGASHLVSVMVGSVGASIPTEGLTGVPGDTIEGTDMDITGVTGMVPGMAIVQVTGLVSEIPIGMYITIAIAE